MKKATIFCMLLLMTYAFALPAMGSQWPDSLTIDSETRQLLGVAQDEEVTRVYLGYFLVGFGDGLSIDKILEESAEYTVYSGNENDAKMIQDGQAVPHNMGFDVSFQYFDNLKHEQILDTLDEGAKIEKIYYMEGKISERPEYWGDLIVYYVTDSGDYVLFNRGGTQEYFLPAEEFRPYAKEITEFRSNLHWGMGETPPEDYLEPKGLAVYKLEIPERNLLRDILLWSIPAVVILTAGGLWIFLRRRKKKEVSPA